MFLRVNATTHLWVKPRARYCLFFFQIICFDMQTPAKNKTGQKNSDIDSILKKKSFGNEAGTF